MIERWGNKNIHSEKGILCYKTGQKPRWCNCGEGCQSGNTHSKVGGGKAVRGGDVGGSGSVGVEGIDVGEQGAHHSGNTRTHVLRGEAGKVSKHTSRGHYCQGGSETAAQWDMMLFVDGFYSFMYLLCLLYTNHND